MQACPPMPVLGAVLEDVVSIFVLRPGILSMFVAGVAIEERRPKCQKSSKKIYRCAHTCQVSDNDLQVHLPV